MYFFKKLVWIRIWMYRTKPDPLVRVGFAKKIVRSTTVRVMEIFFMKLTVKDDRRVCSNPVSIINSRNT